MAALTPRCIVASLAATVIGAIPAAGGDIASIICWGNAKKLSKHPEEYGNGSVEGLAISSASNNGVIGGAMTTMMTLGIPGDSVTAILIGSLTMYGMQPGIKMFTEHASFTAQIMMLMVMANIVFLVFGLITVKASAKVLNVAQPTVWAAVSVLCVVGAFALNNNFFDVIVMLIAAILGFTFKVYKFPTGPFILGLLLGGMLESNMRRALVMSHGSYAPFITRPVSGVLLIMIVITFLSPLFKMIFKRSKAKRASSESV
jgi:putative tricarboxylic transport membrane protein